MSLAYSPEELAGDLPRLGRVTYEGIADWFGCSTVTARRLVRVLREQGRLVVVGENPNPRGRPTPVFAAPVLRADPPTWAGSALPRESR